jgi:hypothetical protein
MLKARSRRTLAVIMTSIPKVNVVFMQMLANTKEIKPDIIGIILRKSVLLSKVGVDVVLFRIYSEIHCKMIKYNNLLGTERMITFRK